MGSTLPPLDSPRAAINVARVAEFARHHVASEDIDPVYPVLRFIEREARGSDDLTDETSLWHTLVYEAWYSLASGETAWEYGLEGWPQRGAPAYEVVEDLMRRPTGVERRSLRGGRNMYRHLTSLLACREHHGSFSGWLTQGFDGDPVANWDRVRVNAAEAWGNGRWATYKLAELLWKVNGLPLLAPDMGNAESTGPREGLALVYEWDEPPTGNAPATIRFLDEKAEELRAELRALGVDATIEQLETVLCDFKSLVKGRYYNGRDIDEMLAGILEHEVPTVVRERLLEARAAVLPHDYLGELMGWRGVDKPRLSHFKRTGQIATRWRTAESYVG